MRLMTCPALSVRPEVKEGGGVRGLPGRRGSVAVLAEGRRQENTIVHLPGYPEPILSSKARNASTETAYDELESGVV